MKNYPLNYDKIVGCRNENPINNLIFDSFDDSLRVSAIDSSILSSTTTFPSPSHIHQFYHKNPIEILKEKEKEKEKDSIIDNTNYTDEDDDNYYWTTFHDEKNQLASLISLMESDLSEPYSIYTYRYFLYSWPWLCHLVYASDKDEHIKINHHHHHDHHLTLENEHRNNPLSSVTAPIIEYSKMTLIGASIGRITRKKANPLLLKGYIAMLAVLPSFRKKGIGKKLISKMIHSMTSVQVNEIVLETEISNIPAVHLYDSLGFMRYKKLPKYYCSGNDAFRFKYFPDYLLDEDHGSGNGSGDDDSYKDRNNVGLQNEFMDNLTL